MAISMRQVKAYLILITLVSVIVCFLMMGNIRNFIPGRVESPRLKDASGNEVIPSALNNIVNNDGLHQLPEMQKQSVIRWALHSLLNESELLNSNIQHDVYRLFRQMHVTAESAKMSLPTDRPNLIQTTRPNQGTGKSKFMLPGLPDSFFNGGPSGKTPLIPKIIHQTWDNYMVPKMFAPWIKNFVDKNPDWEYWFWTPDDVKCLLKKYYPQYSSLYDSYWAMIFKSDVMRYFVLYHFGGFYADLDVDCLKPLDVWQYEQALFMHETYEHIYLVHERDDPNVMTTIMASRKNHPVMRMLFESLPKYHKKFPNDVLHSTGPYFLDAVYRQFIETKEGKDPDNGITVVHPKYFLPTFDDPFKEELKKRCISGAAKKGGPLSQGAVEVCNLFKSRNYTNNALPESFTDHHWVHVNLKKSSFKTENLVSLFDYAPKAKKISSFLTCT